MRDIDQLGLYRDVTDAIDNLTRTADEPLVAPSRTPVRTEPAIGVDPEKWATMPRRQRRALLRQDERVHRKARKITRGGTDGR